MGSGPLVPNSSAVVRDSASDFAAVVNRSFNPGYQPIIPQESVLQEYLRTLIKRKWTIVGCVALIFGVVAIGTFRTTPIYEAAGSIAINRIDPMMMNFKDPSGGWSYFDPTELDTEVRILRSDLLALQVIRQLDLDKRPEFGGSGQKPATLELTTEGLQPDSARTSSLLSGFKGSLSVSLIPNTRIVEIRFRSPDKDLAARVVNTLINTYVEQNFKTRYESTMQKTDWLSKQLVDLQMQVETSQEKLVKYQKEHSILGGDEKQNIITTKLDELNKQLTAAESERMEKQSVYELMQAGDPETLAAASHQGQGATLPSNATGTLLERLRGQQADLRIQIAEFSTQFGPAYPKVVQLNNQLKEVNAQMVLEAKKSIEHSRSDYLTALEREKMLRAAMDQQKQEANALNESAIEYTLLKRDVETNRTLYEGLLEKLKEAGVSAGLRSTNVRNVDQARVPMSPSEPNVPRNLMFALALGLTTGVGLAFLMETLDNTVRTPEQAQMISALPSLGMIPLGSKPSAENAPRRLALSASKEAVELVTQARPQSQMAEAYRALRTSILLTSAGGPPKVVLVTSALPQEGKTTTSINTAIVLAQKGARVLLIDADLRRPSVHKTLGMAPHNGLSNVLTATAELQQCIVRSPILPSLFILPAGTPPPNPAELLASTNMKDVLTVLREQYDHIVIDTPPTLSVTDAVIVSTCADSVVLVIRSGQTTKQALRRARDLLVRVSAKTAGVLLNAVDLASPDYYYYYEYQGKYGQRYYREDDLTDTDSSGPSHGPAST